MPSHGRVIRGPHSFPALMLVEPWHDLDKVAGAVAVVQLKAQDLVPGVLAGTGAAGQGKEIGAARDAASGAALDRRGADLLHRDHGKDRAESVDLFLVDIAMRLDRDIAP